MRWWITHTNSYVYGDSDRDSYSNGYVYGNTWPEPNCNGNCDVNGDACHNSNSDSDTECGSSAGA